MDGEDSIQNLIVQQNFPLIKSNNLSTSLKNRVNNREIENYVYSNGNRKYLVARTSKGYYFISKDDIPIFEKNPLGFLLDIRSPIKINPPYGDIGKREVVGLGSVQP